MGHYRRATTTRLRCSRSQPSLPPSPFCKGLAQATLAADGSASRWRFYHLAFKGHALGVVFPRTSLRSIGIRKDFEVIGVSDLFARIHVNQQSF